MKIEEKIFAVKTSWETTGWDWQTDKRKVSSDACFSVSRERERESREEKNLKKREKLLEKSRSSLEEFWFSQKNSALFYFLPCCLDVTVSIHLCIFEVITLITRSHMRLSWPPEGVIRGWKSCRDKWLRRESLSFPCTCLLSRIIKKPLFFIVSHLSIWSYRILKITVIFYMNKHTSTMVWQTTLFPSWNIKNQWKTVY